MSVRNKIIFLLLLSATLGVSAQYTLNSPYSRYGFGDLNGNGYSFNRSMGGTGIGLREPNTINILNPASYNAQDSMSFIWDFGVLGNYKSYKTSANNNSVNNMNFDHISFSFPVTKKYYISAGLLPYSKIGYQLGELNMLPDSSYYSSTYKGSGNINQFYIGHAVGLLNNRLSVGANIQYLFGAIDYSNSVVFQSEALGSSAASNARLAGWNINLGLQSVILAKGNSALTLGVTYQTQTKLTGNVIRTITSSSNKQTDTLSNSGYSIPEKLGVGAGYRFKNLVFGIDYSIQNWKNVKIPNNTTALGLSNRISGGIQYTYDKDSYRSYFERVRYRAGAYYENSALKLNNTNINEFGLSLGFGFPFKRTNTMFNTAFEFGQRGTTQNNLIKENYLRLTFNVSLYDFWFIKRKYQ